MNAALRLERMPLDYDIADFSNVELEAIERSGKCSLLEYIQTPSQWPQNNSAVIPLMEQRPGAIPFGERPKESNNWLYEGRDVIIRLPKWRRYHIYGNRQCSTTSQLRDNAPALLNVMCFGRAVKTIDSFEICSKCNATYEAIQKEL